MCPTNPPTPRCYLSPIERLRDEIFSLRPALSDAALCCRMSKIGHLCLQILPDLLNVAPQTARDFSDWEKALHTWMPEPVLALMRTGRGELPACICAMKMLIQFSTRNPDERRGMYMIFIISEEWREHYRACLVKR